MNRTICIRKTKGEAAGRYTKTRRYGRLLQLVIENQKMLLENQQRSYYDHQAILRSQRQIIIGDLTSNMTAMASI